jgi:hypothetical protein
MPKGNCYFVTNKSAIYTDEDFKPHGFEIFIKVTSYDLNPHTKGCADLNLQGYNCSKV